ncbi:hypothetical protein SMICM17S_05634 [Streptomyces microflavus]
MGGTYTTGGGDADVDTVVLTLYGSLLGQLCVIVLGILVTAGEYATGMIRSSLTAVPTRFPPGRRPSAPPPRSRAQQPPALPCWPGACGGRRHWRRPLWPYATEPPDRPHSPGRSTGECPGDGPPH